MFDITFDSFLLVDSAEIDKWDNVTAVLVEVTQWTKIISSSVLVVAPIVPLILVLCVYKRYEWFYIITLALFLIHNMYSCFEYFDNIY